MLDLIGFIALPVILTASITLLWAPLLSIPPANIAYYILVDTSIKVVVAILRRAADNEPDIGSLVIPLAIWNAFTTLLYPSLLCPPAKTAYYYLLELSIIVPATNLSRAAILVIVFELTVYGIPIQKVSIILDLLPLPYPPANTAYYILVTESVTVVAAKPFRGSDSISVVVSGISFPLVIQNISIAAD